MKLVKSIEHIDNLEMSVPSGRADYNKMPEIPKGEICTVIEEADYIDRKFYRLKEYQDETGKTHWFYPSELFEEI